MTRSTVVLSDIKAEIGPQKLLDLEKVAKISAIQSSHDLRTALKSSVLKLVRQEVVRIAPAPLPEVRIVEVEKVIEKHHHHHNPAPAPDNPGLDEAKILSIMRQVMNEGKKSDQTDDMKLVLSAMQSLQDKMSNINSGSDKLDNTMPDIDPKKFAEMQAKAIESIKIETSNTEKLKKIVIKTEKKLGDLASEL